MNQESGAGAPRDEEGLEKESTRKPRIETESQINFRRHKKRVSSKEGLMYLKETPATANADVHTTISLPNNLLHGEKKSSIS